MEYESKKGNKANLVELRGRVEQYLKKAFENESDGEESNWFN